TDGRILDFELLPANADERTALDELLPRYRDLVIFADKGFLDQARQAELYQRYGHRLHTPKRQNQREQHPKAWDRYCTQLRQRVETAIDQAKDFFGLEQPAAL